MPVVGLFITIQQILYIDWRVIVTLDGQWVSVIWQVLAQQYVGVSSRPLR